MRITIGNVNATTKDRTQSSPNWIKIRQLKRLDRRKNQTDRRKNMRDGVIVTLSFKKNQRSSTDRRSNR